MPWSPPDGFVPAPSALPGVTVYAPGAAAGATRPTCPRCGAPTGWNPKRTRHGCTRCEWSEALTALTEGPGTFTPAALRRGDLGWGAARGRTLRCDGCGAEVSLPAGTLATTCAFCGSAHLRTTEGEPGLRPHTVLPFALPLAAARDAARAWLGRGWWHPGDLGRAALDHLTGVYVPAWRFGAVVEGTWRAQVGYTETWTEHDSQGRPRVRSRVRWREEEGAVRTPFADLLVPGSTDLPPTLFHTLFPVDMAAVRPYQPEVLADFRARAFTLPLAEAWEAGRARMREETEAACRGQIHGDHVRAFTMRADFAQQTWEYLLLPVYVSAFRYQEKVWMVGVDGRTGKVSGPKPVAWGKVAFACVAALLPGVVGLIVPPVGLVLLLLGVAAVIGILVSASRAGKGLA